MSDLDQATLSSEDSGGVDRFRHSSHDVRFSSARRLTKRARRVRFTAMQARLVVLASLIALFSVLSPYFLTPTNFSNIIVSAAVVGIIANAMTLLIVAGQVDVSVGSGVGFAAVAFATVAPDHGIALAIGAALLASWSICIVNIVSIVIFRVPSIIATLATMLTFAGVQKLVINGQNLGVFDFTFVGQERLRILGTGVPIAALLFAGITAFFFVVMRYTRFGLHMYAIGANPRAATLAGLKLGRTVTVGFLLTGCAVTVAALILVSQTGVVSPTTGLNLQFLALTGVMLGGASLYGGRGSVLGTVIAILILGVLNNGLVLVQVSSFWQEVLQGALLLGAVMFDELARRSREVRMTI